MTLASGAENVGLSQVSTEALQQLLQAVRSGALRVPLTSIGLEHAGVGYLRDSLRPFMALERGALTLLFDSIVAERAHSQRGGLELVWSGTDSGPSHARYTRIVIPEMIAAAKQQITIAGYSFDAGAGVFELLHEAVLARHVQVRFFLDIEQLRARLEQQLGKERRRSRMQPLKLARQTSADEYARSVVSLFLELHWPYEGLRPELYYDPRTAEPRSFASLHAKCLIADHERSLITSANFTDRGQARNIEVGILVRDKAYAVALERQWNSLIASGGVLKV